MTIEKKNARETKDAGSSAGNEGTCFPERLKKAGRRVHSFIKERTRPEFYWTIALILWLLVVRQVIAFFVGVYGAYEGYWPYGDIPVSGLAGDVIYDLDSAGIKTVMVEWFCKIMFFYWVFRRAFSNWPKTVRFIFGVGIVFLPAATAKYYALPSFLVCFFFIWFVFSKRRWFRAFLVIFCFFFLPTRLWFDDIYGRMRFMHLCATEAKYEVYDTVELPGEFRRRYFYRSGNGTREAEGASVKVLPYFVLWATTYEKGDCSVGKKFLEKNEIPKGDGWFCRRKVRETSESISTHTQTYSNMDTGKILGELRTYYFNGGWLRKALGGRRKEMSCPNMKTRMDIHEVVKAGTKERKETEK